MCKDTVYFVAIHKLSFMTFLLSSVVYMILHSKIQASFTQTYPLGLASRNVSNVSPVFVNPKLRNFS